MLPLQRPSQTSASLMPSMTDAHQSTPGVNMQRGDPLPTTIQDKISTMKSKIHLLNSDPYRDIGEDL